MKKHEALRRLQRRIEHFYELERTPDVVDFVRTGSSEHRETLVLRQNKDDLEIALVLPPLADSSSLDQWLQVVEGVSHFVYVAERARTNLPATRLELELQAEVDKFVLLSLSRGRVEPHHVRKLHGQLYDNVRFLHPPGSEDGERYRLANDLAARFTARLVGHGDLAAIARTLRRFYRSGQAEKIHLARAA